MIGRLFMSRIVDYTDDFFILERNETEYIITDVKMSTSSISPDCNIGGGGPYTNYGKDKMRGI